MLLLVVAGLLREAKSLLLGEPAEGKLLAQIRELACAQPASACGPCCRFAWGPYEILVVLPVEFAPDLPASQLVEATKRLRKAIRHCPRRAPRLRAARGATAPAAPGGPRHPIT